MTLRIPVIWLFALICLSPLYARAAELVNINTADAALLDTLPGIGPSKAAAIIDYRTQHGSFARIEDIQKVSGIGPSTYADIAPLITVGETVPSSPPSTPDATASSTPSATATIPTSTGNSPPEYIPIPTLRIITVGNRTVSSGADTAFTAVIYDSRGNKRDDALVAWSFGDGMRRTGASVFHRYYDQGEYLAVVRATTVDGGDARSEITVTVKNAGIKITAVSSSGITLTNGDSRTLDLSLWRLSAGGQEFKIPEDTQILAGRSILFPSPVIQLPLASSASLLYPSGEVAATYPTTAVDVQPPTSPQSYKQVQAVETSAISRVKPIISQKNVQAYEETVIAPREMATSSISRGAALSSTETVSSTPIRASGLFRSPWTFSFLGVMALAGAAFIFL
jgi:competence ComEA-like helix-hairpin-helix protein